MFKLENAIIPTPVNTINKGSVVILGELSESCYKLNNTAPGICAKSAERLIEEAFEGVWAFENPDSAFTITLQTDENHRQFDEAHTAEAYCIEITKAGAVLTGKGDAGTLYAAISFSKLIFKDGNKVCLPECFILDYPRFKVRGHFMECRWGSDFLTFDEWKLIIDELADAKINTVTVGVYGCWMAQYDNIPAEYQYIPFKSHPELKTPRSVKYYSAVDKKHHAKHNVLPTMYNDDYLGELIAYGKTKNVEVFPLFNSLGHNSLIPRLHPEITPIGENGEHTGELLCISNDKTYEFMFELYDEIIDRYLKPNGIDSFAVGLDEVVGYNCMCDGCRDKDFGDLIVDYIIRIAKYLKQKGIKNLYVYHDMLLHHNKLTKETADLFKKEGVWDIIVIDWWCYYHGERFFEGKASEVNNHFRGIGKPISGYYFWSVMLHSAPNVEQMAVLAQKNDFEGMIAYSAYDDFFDFNFKQYAQSTWCPDSKSLGELAKIYAEQHFPELDGAYDTLLDVLDFTLSDQYKEHYCSMFFHFYNTSYFNKKEYPQNYPAKRFKAMNEDEKYINYLNDVLPRARRAYNFFSENTYGKAGDIWTVATFGYVAHLDSFYTMYMCDKDFNDGKLGTGEYIKEINRLICQYEKYMAMCENVRIEANKYITLRNISVDRQFLIDIKGELQRQLKSGEKTELVLAECKPVLSKASWFLR